jgi:hypothetical protein
MEKNISNISNVYVIATFPLTQELHSPLSNLFLKVTPKLTMHMNDQTFKWGESLITTLKPTIKMIVK